MFSPYYAWARRSGKADALDHCAVNVALYGPGGGRWSMTERGRGDVWRDAAQLRIGPSRLAWEHGALVVDIDEVCAPWPRRVRGRVRVEASRWLDADHGLDVAGTHRWRPLAPCARVVVDLDRPDLRWSGAGYVDSNRGDAPLERDIADWDWSRTRIDGARTLVHYDVRRRVGGALALSMLYDADGGIESPPPVPRTDLPRSRWGVARAARSDGDAAPSVIRTLEDGPFYARSLVAAQWRGRAVTAVHESVSLARFAAPWVQAMLPLRMPRRAR